MKTKAANPRKKAPSPKRDYAKDPFEKLKDGKPYMWSGPIDNDVAVAIFKKKQSSDVGASVVGILNAALRAGLKEQLKSNKPKK